MHLEIPATGRDTHIIFCLSPGFGPLYNILISALWLADKKVNKTEDL